MVVLRTVVPHTVVPCLVLPCLVLPCTVAPCMVLPRTVAQCAVTRCPVYEYSLLTSSNSCFGHVIQLGIEDFMRKVTQIAIVESKQAIWDYDPQLVENQIAVGGLDVIAIIRTLAVKVRPLSIRRLH